MNWTLRQMEILVAAAEATTFSAAAKKLGISQPSLSESIRRLERAIGLVLFERTTRSLKLTEDGRAAAAMARELMRDFRHGLESLTARRWPHRNRRAALGYLCGDTRSLGRICRRAPCRRRSAA